MKLAVMQPYVFPYVGYFQLLNSSDKFIFYNDVNFIKQGWINRNNILCQGKPLLFTIPLEKQSSFAKINEVETSHLLFGKWRDSFLKTIDNNYKKAPYYDQVKEVILDTIFDDVKQSTISELAILSIKNVLDYLSIEKNTIASEGLYHNNDLAAESRIIDICLKENASIYINPIGGIELYSKQRFSDKGLELLFIKPNLRDYKQFSNDFVPALSIIDVLMFNSVTEVKNMLNDYQFV
jgi:hypothetical protein